MHALFTSVKDWSLQQVLLTRSGTQALAPVIPFCLSKVSKEKGANQAEIPVGSEQLHNLLTFQFPETPINILLLYYYLWLTFVSAIF